MKIENLTLAEIVTAKPEAAVLFENYNLDFCCGGKQKLSDALSKEPARLHEVQQQLIKIFESELKPEIDFDQISLTTLIDYILDTHHRYVKENLPVIQQHLQKVSLKHGDTYPEMKRIANLFTEVLTDFEQHMMKEENILFPRIKKLESIVQAGIVNEGNFSIQQAIHMMEHEHETAGNAMEEIKALCNQYTPPPGACTTFSLSLDELRFFEQDLHQHVHLENNILFPKAIKLEEKLAGTLPA